MKQLEKKVKKILSKNKASRADDDLLYLLVLKEMKFDISKYSAEEFIKSYRKMKLPTIETVGRARRKAQTENPILKPTKEIELKRRKCEQSFYEYSLIKKK